MEIFLPGNTLSEQRFNDTPQQEHRDPCNVQRNNSVSPPLLNLHVEYVFHFFFLKKFECKHCFSHFYHVTSILTINRYRSPLTRMKQVPPSAITLSTVTMPTQLAPRYVPTQVTINMAKSMLLDYSGGSKNVYRFIKTTKRTFFFK